MTSPSGSSVSGVSPETMKDNTMSTTATMPVSGTNLPSLLTVMSLPSVELYPATCAAETLSTRPRSGNRGVVPGDHELRAVPGDRLRRVVPGGRLGGHQLGVEAAVADELE